MSNDIWKGPYNVMSKDCKVCGGKGKTYYDPGDSGNYIEERCGACKGHGRNYFLVDTDSTILAQLEVKTKL